MTPAILLTTAIEPAMTLLPERMDSPQARRMLVAIALQESSLAERRQIGSWDNGIPRYGPARGWWQFEGGGILGVIRHKATASHLAEACHALGYENSDPSSLHRAVEHNDVLAAVFARLNLWWLPWALAETQQEGWAQYIEAWRPGKPHPNRWPQCWDTANIVTGLA